MMTEHWNHDFPLNPRTKYGFIYEVLHKETGKRYIGKKVYHFRRKKHVAGRKAKKRVVFESDWRTYTGSSKTLNKDIKQEGMDAFEFTILFECDTLGHLSYSEANLQHKRDVLTARLPGGEMAYYNRAIMGIKFIPAGDEEAVRGLEDSIEHAKYLEHTHVSEEVARKISESQSTTGTVEWFHRERGFFEATVYEICRDYPEVNPGTLRWVALGNRYSHKGFVLAYEYRKTGKEPKTVPHYSTDPLTVTHPEHGIRTGRKSELARDIGIDRRRLHELSKGERDEYKGWRIY